MLKKNDLVQIKIEDIGSEGEGIGKVDGLTLFIKDAIVGDYVEARIVKMKKNYGYARVDKIIQSSIHRVEPKCSYHKQCGGCQIQALEYKKQLEYKSNKVKQNFIRLGNFHANVMDQVLEPIIGMEEPFHYRNKAQYPVGTDKEGNIVTGFYAGRTHSIISNTDCFLGVKENKEILEVILKFMNQYHIEPYQEELGIGCIRHILIRTGFTSNEIMVCLVINKPLSNQRALIEMLTKNENITSIMLSYNRQKTNVIMGKEIECIWGKPTISDTIHVRDMEKKSYPQTGESLSFHISPLSFYQVNPIQTETLYSLALQYAGLTGEETVWDLYCGIGTISLFLASKAKKVYGIEIIPQAIEDAKDNAIRNHITNTEFYVGEAEKVLPKLYEEEGIYADRSYERR